MLTKTDLIIIGAGPVGIFTAFQAGILGIKSSIIDVGSIPGGQCNALYPEKYIYDIPGYTKITAQDLIKNLIEQAAQFDPKYFLKEMAIKIFFEDDSVIINTDRGNFIKAKSLIIAAGCGAFDYNKIPIQGIESYEETSLHYSVVDVSIFKNQIIAIAGGGDSAADWAIELSEIAKKIYLVHRRNNFRCTQHSTEKILYLQKIGKIEIIVPFQINQIYGNGKQINELEVISIDKSSKINFTIDHLLAFFGTKMNLLHIKDWGIAMDGHHIKVDHRTCETNLKKVYAVGDVCSYDGKLKLILTGFAESARACHSIYPTIFPDRAFNFEYSTNKIDIFK